MAVLNLSAINNHLKQLLRALDLLPDLVMGVDWRGNITFASKSATRLLQYSAEILCKISILDLITPETRHVMSSVLQRKFIRDPYYHSVPVDCTIGLIGRERTVFW